MPTLPSGTVTFLFTDIEDSTPLWEREPDQMHVALARHDAILRSAITDNGGHAFKKIGDAFQAAFAFPAQALAAALAAQRAFAQQPWQTSEPLRVRMGLHIGPAVAEDTEYHTSHTLNRVARIMSCAHGGQILLSLEVAEMVRRDLGAEVSLRDMGKHRLKGLTHLEHLFQVVVLDLPDSFPPLKTLDARPTNLPIQATALIGREQEIATVQALLRRDDVRLVTLTGPGGTGKTRLGLQVAAELLDAFADGVFFAALGPITDPDLVASTIAQALGVKESGGQPLVAQLKGYLQTKELLLLLDNFEQVVDAAPLVGELLSAATGLKVLVTSRTVLHLYGEREYAVAPLALPETPLPPLERLTQYEAVRLFIERAQAVKADFSVTNANAPAVAEICARLDGLPLAIELAAKRSKLFSPQALLARLGNRLEVLTGGAHNLPARQQTIRNTIDWSYNLLIADEQLLFRRLGVFVGGCTLETAEAVCNADADLPLEVLEGLGSLVDHSLLRQQEGGTGEPRFLMLETIREYALERLVARGEADALRDRHLAHYLALAEAAEPHFRGAAQIVWADRLEFEHDNFRAALAWAHERGAVEGATAGDAEVELRLAGALFWFWHIRNYLTEGRRWLDEALMRANGAARTATQATALFGAGALASVQGDLVAARTRLEESAAIWREVGDKRGLALSLSYDRGLGWVALYEGRAGIARAFFEEGVTLWRELGDKWGLAFALWGLSAVVRRDDPTAARPIVEESVALFRAIGDRKGLALALFQLGIVTRLEGDHTRAGALIKESLAVGRELGDKELIAQALGSSGDMAHAQGDYQRAMALYQEGLALVWPLDMKDVVAVFLVSLAGIAGAVKQAERAARLLSAGETLLNTIGLPVSVWPEHRANYDRYVADARAQLAEATFAAAWAEGQTMTLEQAIAEALAFAAEAEQALPSPPASAISAASAAFHPGLSEREVEILRLVAQGLTDAQVAERLVISPRTVQGHLRSIYGKLDVTSRTAATRFAIERGLL